MLKIYYKMYRVLKTYTQNLSRHDVLYFHVLRFQHRALLLPPVGGKLISGLTSCWTE